MGPGHPFIADWRSVFGGWDRDRAKRARRFWSGVCDRPGDPALADASGKKTGSLNAIRYKVITLLPFRQAMSQARGQARIQNLLLGGADVVIEAAEFDG